MMATFMAIMIPRAAVCAERIGEVLDTESVGRAAGGAGHAAARSAASSSCATSSSATRARPRRCCATSRSPRSPGRRPRSSAAPAPARPRCSSLIPRLFDATGGQRARRRRRRARPRPRGRCGRRIGLVPQRPYLFTGTVAQQPALRQPGRHRRGAVGTRSRSPRRATSSRRCPRAWRRRSRRAAPTSPAASASGSRSRGRWCASPRSTCSTTRSPRSTSPPTRGCAPRCEPRHRATRPWSSSRSACRPSPTPTRSSCSTTARIVGIGTHDGAARDLPDLRRDRRVPARGAGGGMSTASTSDDRARRTRDGDPPRRGMAAAAAAAARAAMGRWQHGHAGGEGDGLRPVGAAAARAAAPRSACGVVAGARCSAVVSVGAHRDRAEDPRPRHRHHLRRVSSASSCPPGSPHEQAGGAGARAAGNSDVADMLARHGRRARPRHRLRARSATCCSLVARRSTSARRCSAGCRATCSTTSSSAPSSGCARDVEDKLNRLPLSYFDRQPRGEVLSRVTNDIDNVAQSLQQTLSQMLTSLLTVIGVLRDDVRDLAAARGDRAGHRPAVGRGHRADRQARAEALRRAVEAHRRAQRPDRGGVHRPRAGQGVRPARARSRTRVPRQERGAVRRELRRAVHLRASSCRR